MNRTIAALGIGGVMLATSAAAETIKVATWNIANFTVGSRTVAELSAMADLVAVLNSDVIAAQGVIAAASRVSRHRRVPEVIARDSTGRGFLSDTLPPQGYSSFFA